MLQTPGEVERTISIVLFLPMFSEPQTWNCYPIQDFWRKPDDIWRRPKTSKDVPKISDDVSNISLYQYQDVFRQP